MIRDQPGHNIKPGYNSNRNPSNRNPTNGNPSNRNPSNRNPSILYFCIARYRPYQQTSEQNNHSKFTVLFLKSLFPYFPLYLFCIDGK